jgi:hypothetical protein
MPKVRLNQLLNSLRGGIGNLVFRQRPDGTTIISGAPLSRGRKATPKQKAHRERFKEASRYARWAARHYPVYAKLAAGTPDWKSPYNFALSDWFEAPVIHRVERRDGCIHVEASDNIGVTRVRVSVLDDAGKVLERGDATRTAENCWEFASQTQGKSVIAEAWDLPEHVTKVLT